MISFVIPTLNEASVLEKTLLWLSWYSWEKEIIISDGKSRDATIEIANKFTDKVVVYDSSKRQTIGQARNMWADIAKGEYICFLDADVIVVEPDLFFEKILQKFKSDKKIVALTVFMKVLPGLETTADRIIYGALNYFYSFLNRIWIGAATGEFQFVTAEAFKKVWGFDEILIGGEDSDHFYKLSKIGRTIFADDLIAFHTGRRPHKVGWPKLLLTWFITLFPMSIRKFFLKEWKEVR